jgi:hypothetical protein
MATRFCCRVKEEKDEKLIVTGITAIKRTTMNGDGTMQEDNSLL